MKTNFKMLALLMVLVVPSFALLFRPGIHSMHDFHPFRLYEFVHCNSFPCRWATDAGAGYGEPVFNYYGQFPYWLGSLFYFSGFSILSSTKLVFIFSIILSAYFMFRLSQKYFGNLGGLISALFYTYAPYRAVDIWVRGAMPEALAFVFFPVILMFPNIFWLSLAITGLVITHNLSALMFLPFALLFAISQKQTIKFIYSNLIAIFLSAFYLVPLYWEKNLVSLNQFTQDLYQYQIHYTTLNQLFISRFWGFGSSVWGVNDNMSFSVGHLHWILPVLILIYFLFLKSKSHILFLLFTLGTLSVFLTHGKSEFIWKLFPPLSYLQFPWRFLSISTFFLSLSAGAIIFINKKLIPVLIILLLLLNINFFRPDHWFSQTDQQYFSGDFWDTQRFASLLDYWPAGAKLPNQIAPNSPFYSIGDKQQGGVIVFPVVNFPGWQISVNNKLVPIMNYSDLKLISVQVPAGNTDIKLKFTDTLSRQIGNLTSISSLLILILCWPLLSSRRS